MAPNCKPRTLELTGSSASGISSPLLGAVKLADITREHSWVLLAEKVQGGMKRTTALKIVALLREIMNHAVENRLIPFDPAARLARFYRGRTE